MIRLVPYLFIALAIVLISSMKQFPMSRFFLLGEGVVSFILGVILVIASKETSSEGMLLGLIGCFCISIFAVVKFWPHVEVNH